MLISSVRYPSINAKLKGMYSQKIKKNDFEELLKQSTTKQAIALLKSLNTDFKNLEDNSDRTGIKVILDNILINDIIKINRLFNEKDKKVLSNFISVYEIKCIKSVFRKISSNSLLNEYTDETQIWVSKIFLNLNGIQNSRDVLSFKEYLKRTQYYQIFNKYINDNVNIDVFKLENKLDKFYFEKMLKISESYNKNLFDMVGKKSDLNNIIWIYRVRKNYNFSKDSIRDILINFNYKLKKNELENLIESDNEKEFFEVLQTTYYSKYINFKYDIELENEIDRYLYNLYKKIFKADIFDIGSVYAYLNMIDDENNDIMNIIEGIRYDLDRDKLKEKLVVC